MRRGRLQRSHVARIFLASLACCLFAAPAVGADETGVPKIVFQESPGKLTITAGEQPLATYVYADPEISRPYFAHVCVPGGLQVTRNHPPKAGHDLVDHGTFHPGIWLAFGDIDGQDFWRNKARVRHDRFVEPPVSKGKHGHFTVQNSYCRTDTPDQVVCQEICRYTLAIETSGYVLVSDSVFFSPSEFAFGDQEEMGLGIRLATPITVKSGGKIMDDAGRINEKEVWGKSSAWCDYSGVIEGRKVGILVMSDPTNFRPARYHVRDYGLLTANPFGQKVFGEAEKSRVVVPAGEPFRLRFGVLLHASDGPELDRQSTYGNFVNRLLEMPRPAPPAPK